ncbi:hypothetical protein K4L44_00905 [Halosquirtibacter laminarini]|uniref:Uncharacterized protein n=1 Tax=Halosquirtibacter laminarini TaxID=3374600 RepID=A0AC61NFP8_9BACT|nr:hypothetical protein K4L44_00905 [Prolixibacteraceae bacterium]
MKRKNISILMLLLIIIGCSREEKAQRKYDETIMVYIYQTIQPGNPTENILDKIAAGVHKDANVIVAYANQKEIQFFQMNGENSKIYLGEETNEGKYITYGHKLLLQKVMSDYPSKKYQSVFIGESSAPSTEKEDVIPSMGVGKNRLSFYLFTSNFYGEKRINPKRMDYAVIIASSFGDPNVIYAFGDFVPYVVASPTEIDLRHYPYKEMFDALTTPQISIKEKLEKGCKEYLSHAETNHLDGSISLYDCTQFDFASQRFSNINISNDKDLIKNNLSSTNLTKLGDHNYQFDFIEMINSSYNENDSKVLKYEFEKSIIMYGFSGKWTNKNLCGLGVYVPHKDLIRRYIISYTMCWNGMTDYRNLVNNIYR